MMVVVMMVVVIMQISTKLYRNKFCEWFIIEMKHKLSGTSPLGGVTPIIFKFEKLVKMKNIWSK